MDRRFHQPLSREQVAAILRQRAERNLEGAHLQQPGGVGVGGVHAAAPLAAVQVGIRPRPRFRAGGGGIAGPDAVGADLPGAAEDYRAHAAARPSPLYRQASVSDEDAALAPSPARLVNVSVDGEVISYSPTDEQVGLIGLYIDGKSITEGGSRHFFEVEILEKGASVPNIIVGLCSERYPLDIHPGWTSESVGFHTGDGSLYRGRPRGQPFGPACDVGDRIGCGVRPTASAAADGQKVNVFFTRNGKEIGSSSLCVVVPAGGFFPAVGLQHPGEEVAFRHGVRWSPEEDMMLVDGGEDEWLRLHDIRINGQVLEYVGRGKSLIDVGLAQAKTPICTRNHYFEIEIVDPGASCYIAIGLARRDYPKNRHPGWNKGSIAYHADDGKVFVGSGVGAPFGPRCHKGDVMGCGVLFPRNYECKSDSEEEIEQQCGNSQYEGVVVDQDYVQIDELGSDSAEEEEWWNDQVFIQSGVRVQVGESAYLTSRK
ncbi:unnamed protein product [Sphagnum tenellum]